MQLLKFQMDLLGQSDIAGLSKNFPKWGHQLTLPPAGSLIIGLHALASFGSLDLKSCVLADNEWSLGFTHFLGFPVRSLLRGAVPRALVTCTRGEENQVGSHAPFPISSLCFLSTGLVCAGTSQPCNSSPVVLTSSPVGCLRLSPNLG